jgi:hypothetical protein
MYRADGHHMWTMGAPLEATILINRKTDAQVGEDERMGKGRWKQKPAERGESMTEDRWRRVATREERA